MTRQSRSRDSAISSKPFSDVLITFTSASNIPIGNFLTETSDAYLIALLTPRTTPSPEHPPFPLTFRTSTKRATRSPEWKETWHLGGIPSDGFDLTVKLFDEGKPGEFDDRLGIAELKVIELPPAHSDGEAGDPQELVLKIKKRKASRRVYAWTYLIAWCHGDFTKQRGRVTISIQNLGKSTCTRNCPCVLGPMRWTIHYSRMIGRLAGTHAIPDNPTSTPISKVKMMGKKVKQKAIAKVRKDRGTPYCFEAHKFQLLGTIPKELRNVYVEYRPFITFLFSGKGIRGYLLQRGLRAQHRRIYCYDRATRYGLVPSPPEISKIEASHEASEIPEHDKLNHTDKFAASRQFLEMVHYDENPQRHVPGGRLYTYVITLQGEWRFTETGPEFAIQFLSKHSMHSDVSKEIAFAGEFFIRRRRGKGGMKLSDDDDSYSSERQEERHEEADESEPGSKYVDQSKVSEDSKHQYHRDSTDRDEDQHSLHISNKPSHWYGRSHDPRNFVLIIDNDSGTYRPDKNTLPLLQTYLERNLAGLKVKALDWDDDRLKKWKEEQKPKKEVIKARRRFEQVSSSSDSSSDDDDNVQS